MRRASNYYTRLFPQPDEPPTASTPLTEFLRKHYFAASDQCQTVNRRRNLVWSLNQFIKFLGREPTVGESYQLFLGWRKTSIKRQNQVQLLSLFYYMHSLGLGGLESLDSQRRKLRESRDQEGTLWHLCTSRYFLTNLHISSPQTEKQYKIALGNLRDFLGREPTPKDLTEENIVGMMRMLQKKGLAPRTVNERKQRLCALWTWCAKKRIVDEFPTITDMRVPEKIPRAWTKEDLAKLFDGLSKLDGTMGEIRRSDWWVGIHRVLWDTGERIGAVLRARWEWLDFEIATLSIPAEVRKGGVKTGVYRLHTETIDMLRTIKGQSSSELIFPWPQNEYYIWKVYKDLLKSFGLTPDKRVAFHQMRRSVASHLEASGVNATLALQHSSAEVTRKSYLDPRIVIRTAPSQVLFRPDTRGGG